MKKKRLIFHVGLAKTGSSALQAFLSNNVGALREQGIDYPNPEPPSTDQSPRSGNMIHLMQRWAAKEKRNFNSIGELTDHYIDRVLEQSLKNFSSPVMILSGEFQTAQASYEMLPRLKALRRDYQVEVFGFVRDPYDTFVSAWKQRIKTGNDHCDIVEGIAKSLDDKKDTQFCRLLTLQSAADRFVLANYDRCRGDISRAFFERLDLDVDINHLPQAKTDFRNASLTLSEARLVALCARHVTSRSLHTSLVAWLRDNKRFERGKSPVEPVISEVEQMVFEKLAPTFEALNAFLPAHERLRTQRREGVPLADLTFDTDVVADLLRHVEKMFAQQPRSVTNPVGEAPDLPEGFDGEAYLNLNPDVRAAGVDPQEHYLRHGRYESRRYM